MPSAPSLIWRAILAVTLTLGFYLLAISMAGLLLYIPYAEWTYSRRIHPRIVLFCLIGAFTILWAIVPRIDRFAAPGIQLHGRQQPRLFHLITSTAQGCGQRLPAEVYVIPAMNAWVAQRGGFMGLGSRRVMGLGLPLMQVLSPSQFQAVLAHEFGHYVGGDTKLGPWIYKTRASIVRTIQGLSQHSSVLQKPFLWYGSAFLRVTHAISRQQEYAADLLAAQVAGKEPAMEGLRKIHSLAPAYEAYWGGEVSPVLSEGFVPPISEGFRQFVSAPMVAGRIAAILDEELKRGKTDPYDTHPSLAERLAALSTSPMGKTIPDNCALAIQLLDDVPQLEISLVQQLARGGKSFKAISWDRIPETVWMPVWYQRLELFKLPLSGMTPKKFPLLVSDPETLTRRLGIEAETGMTSGQKAQLALETVAIAFAVGLYQQGWEIKGKPGNAIVATKGEVSFQPFALVQQLAAGKVSKESWDKFCWENGIGDLVLEAAKPSGG